MKAFIIAWKSRDDMQGHTMITFAAALIAGVSMEATGVSFGLEFGSLIGLALISMKELRDSQIDYRDLQSNLLGALVAYAVGTIIVLIISAQASGLVH